MDRLAGVVREAVGDGALLTMRPGGNLGDTLIYRGFGKLLEETGVDHVDFDRSSVRPVGGREADRPGDILLDNRIVNWVRDQGKALRQRASRRVSAVYVHGGGNFNDLYGNGIECFRTAVRYFDCPVIVGPQSCQFDETDPRTIFEGVSNQVEFFCREAYSRDIVAEATEGLENVTVHLEEDTAFFLEPEDLPIEEIREEHALLAMRMERDSADPVITDDVEAPIRVSDVSLMEDSYEDWVNSVAVAGRIHTDRLHVAVLGAILDKRVTIYDTGYHKNRGVYEHSLADDPKVDHHELG